MLLLDGLIFFGVLKIPLVSALNLKGSALLKQLGSTLLSIYMAVSGLFTESQELQENKLEYLLICLNAK